MDAVKAVIRLRPPIANGPVVQLECDQQKVCLSRSGYDTKVFSFSAVYGPESTHHDIYSEQLSSLVRLPLEGINATVFAYGHTGAGKTHTMIGTAEDPGLIPRSVQSLVDTAAMFAGTADVSITMSYLEIYNEKVFDLLAAPESRHVDLQIRQDRNYNISVSGLGEVPITSFADFEQAFRPATERRSTAPTRLNQESSRSHAVVLLKVRTQKVTGEELLGKLYLIDLAGSENAKRAGNTGDRLKESGAINQSLFALSKVVSILSAAKASSVFVPYRDSKLTRLLQDSLGGTACAVVLANIAPEESFFQDTLQTLQFAKKSMAIINKPVVRQTGTKKSVIASSRRSVGQTPCVKKSALSAIPSPFVRMTKHLVDEQMKAYRSQVESKLQGLALNLHESMMAQSVVVSNEGSRPSDKWVTCSRSTSENVAPSSSWADLPDKFLNATQAIDESDWLSSTDKSNDKSMTLNIFSDNSLFSPPNELASAAMPLTVTPEVVTGSTALRVQQPATVENTSHEATTSNALPESSTVMEDPPPVCQGLTGSTSLEAEQQAVVENSSHETTTSNALPESLTVMEDPPPVCQGLTGSTLLKAEQQANVENSSHVATNSKALHESPILIQESPVIRQVKREHEEKDRNEEGAVPEKKRKRGRRLMAKRTVPADFTPSAQVMRGMTKSRKAKLSGKENLPYEPSPKLEGSPELSSQPKQRMKLPSIKTESQAVTLNQGQFHSRQQAESEIMPILRYGSVAELQTLPGIGPKRAKHIFKSRQGNDVEFQQMSDLEKFYGISKKTTEKMIKDYISAKLLIVD